MNQSYREQLAKIPGCFSDSGALKFLPDGAERIGREYDLLEQRAYPPMSPAAQADLLTKAAQQQNEMFAKLMPKVDAILNDPNDPRAKMMQQLLGTLGGMPAPHDVAAMRSDVLAGSEISQPQSTYSGFDIELREDVDSSVESVKWLSEHFETLIPGFIEAAKYAYSQLEEENLSDTESSTYIVDNPSDQDYLDRIRILSVEIGSNRRFVFSLEAPSAHLEEHGFYAVFEGSELKGCGEYDIIEELEGGAFDDEEE